MYVSISKAVDSHAQGTWLTPILHVAPLTKLQHSLANPASYAGYTVSGELLGSESTFWWWIKDNLHHRRNWTLVDSICETATKSMFWIPTCVPGFEHVPWLACWKCHGQFANRDDKKFKTHFGNTLRTQNKNIGAAYSMLILTKVKLHLTRCSNGEMTVNQYFHNLQKKKTTTKRKIVKLRYLLLTCLETVISSKVS